MPSYCSLQTARRQLVVQSTTVTDDDLLASLIPEASQRVEDICGQNFDERLWTQGYSGEVGKYNPILNLEGWPWIVINTVTNGDGSALSASQYNILPIGSAYPKTGIRLATGNYWIAPNQSTTTCPNVPPLMNVGYAVDAIQVSGLIGFHRQYLSAWKNTGLTVSGAHTAGTTTLTLSATAANIFDVGDVLKVTTAAGLTEYLRVSGPVASSTQAGGFSTTTPTVERGYNNSTALALAGGEIIYRWAIEPLIARATAEVCAAMYKDRENPTGEKMAVPDMGAVLIPVDTPLKTIKKLGYPYWNHHRGQTR